MLMLVSELFSITGEIMGLDISDLIEQFDLILEENLPEGKSLEDFNGGYVQQLQNDSVFVAFFGTKADGKNKSTSRIGIQSEDIDLMYVMLKAKIHQMRNKKRNKKKLSLSDRFGSKILKEPKYTSGSNSIDELM